MLPTIDDDCSIFHPPVRRDHSLREVCHDGLNRHIDEIQVNPSTGRFRMLLCRWDIRHQEIAPAGILPRDDLIQFPDRLGQTGTFHLV